MAGESFWGEILGFALGLFSKAAPHLSGLVTQVQPMVKSNSRSHGGVNGNGGNGSVAG